MSNYHDTILSLGFEKALSMHQWMKAEIVAALTTYTRSRQRRYYWTSSNRWGEFSRWFFFFVLNYVPWVYGISHYQELAMDDARPRPFSKLVIRRLADCFW